MAVYTDVAADELADFLNQYDLGELLSYKGIAEGVENSNFLLHTTKGSFILTLYEKRVAKNDLPFFLALMTHLAEHGVNCPLPVQGTDGEEVQPGVRACVGHELDYLESGVCPTQRPEGVIHAGLFNDNVFFLGDKLS